jgi:hypothetical protein
VCEQVDKDFFYLPHDDFIDAPKGAYVKAAIRGADMADKPLLLETPFSMSEIVEPLESKGFNVIPVFIQERHDVISDRYFKREGKEIPRGHLSRQNTYLDRAKTMNAFHGTSQEVLNHLKSINP